MNSTDFIPLSEFINHVNDFIGADADKSAKAGKFLLDLSNSFPYFYFNTCIELLNDMETYSSYIGTFAATEIKRFFTETSIRPLSTIENEWFSETSSQMNIRTSAKNALLLALSSSEENIRSLSAFSIISILKIEPEVFESFSAMLIGLLKKDVISEIVICSVLELFTQLLEQSYIENNYPMEPPGSIIELIEFCKYILPQTEIQPKSKIHAIKFIDMLIQHCRPLLNDQSLIYFFVDESIQLYLNLQPIKEKSLRVQVMHTMHQIFTAYYNLEGELQYLFKFKEFFMHCLNCTEEEHNQAQEKYNAKLDAMKKYLEEKRENNETLTDEDKWKLEKIKIKDIHEKLTPVLFLLENCADFEYNLMKNQQPCHFFIQSFSAELIPFLLHLMTPFNPEDENIEDPDDLKPSYFATNALNSVLKTSKEIAWSVIPDIADKVISSQPSTGDVLVTLNCIAALTYGPTIEQGRPWIYEHTVHGIVQFFAKSLNLRLVESSLFTMWRVLKKYPLNAEADFASVFEIIKLHSGKSRVIRVRLTDLLRVCLKAMMAQIPGMLNQYFDDIYAVVAILSAPDNNEREFLVEPYKVFADAIVEMEQTEDNLTLLLNFIEHNIKEMTGKGTVAKPSAFKMTVHVILIAALCAKLKDELASHSDEILSALVSTLSEYDRELWADTIAAISYLIANNSVSSGHFFRLLECLDIIIENGDKKLTAITLRLIGRYVAVSKPPIADSSNKYMERLMQISEESNYDPDEIINVMIAVQQITRTLTRPSDELMMNLMRFIHDVVANIKPCEDAKLSKLGALILSTFYAMTVRLTKSVPTFVKDNYQDMGKFIVFLHERNIVVDNESHAVSVQSNEVLAISCQLLKAFGLSLGKKANVFLNKRCFIEILNLACESSILEIQQAGIQAKKVIQSL